MLLRARLEREGFELSIHENGSEALRAIQARRPDLVLLDVRMPGMDGFDVLSTLRADPERQDVPVIMITALGRESDLVRGFELGADDYMVKPFSPTELLARIHRLLGRKQARS
jgi:DNA-binding response OmpR family regulator